MQDDSRVVIMRPDPRILFANPRREPAELAKTILHVGAVS
jgi:hypothetical protein